MAVERVADVLRDTSLRDDGLAFATILFANVLVGEPCVDQWIMSFPQPPRDSFEQDLQSLVARAVPAARRNRTRPRGGGGTRLPALPGRGARRLRHSAAAARPHPVHPARVRPCGATRSFLPHSRWPRLGSVPRSGFPRLRRGARQEVTRRDRAASAGGVRAGQRGAGQHRACDCGAGHPSRPSRPGV